MVGVGAEVVVWNDNNGTESTAKIFEVIQKKHGRVGRLEEPFGSKMGLFDLERLINEGKSESFDFYVFLPARWDKAGAVGQI
jgi:hypothetical protein